MTVIQIDLSGRMILITGAMGAIAKHMVKRLNAGGATLVLLDLKPANEAHGALRKWRVPDRSYVYRFINITDSVILPRVMNETFERFPDTDTVLGHAGGCGLHPFGMTSESEFERIFRFNFLAKVALTRAVLAHCTKRKTSGRLIFTSFYVAQVPHTQILPYASAKVALENFASCMALEYASSGIRVNVVSPENVAAGSSLKVFEEDAAYHEFVLRVSLGRRKSPESIAAASPLVAEISGQTLGADKGSGIRNRS